jgi:hypothetical protein
MSVDCLFDTNAIVKYYHEETGSEIIKYLFDKSPTAIINLPNIQVIEVVSTFYKLRKQDEIKTDEELIAIVDTFLRDIRERRIRLYDFGTSHLADVLPVCERAFSIPPPINRRKSFIPFKEGLCPELKHYADMGDIALLMLMREIKFVYENGGDVAYFFTSDGHVKRIAASFDIQVIDPELVKNIRDLPASLDGRNRNRVEARLTAFIKDAQVFSPLGSSRILNISPEGACVNSHKNKNLEKSREVVLSIYAFNASFKPVDKIGRVVWTSDSNSGIKFLEPLGEDVMSSIKEHCCN